GAVEGALLWQPSEEFKRGCNMSRYMEWVAENKGLRFADYHDLWRWSVTDLEGFWASIWEFFAIKASRPYSRVLAERKMPGARWFEGAELNYAEQVFRHRAAGKRPALLLQSEIRPLTEVSWDDLYRQVAAVATALRNMGVRRGDRVVAYVPNIPEAVIAFLACASIGAIWSSCSPDFGSRSVVDRFRQIEPKVLFAVDGYQYGGKPFDRRPVVAELQRALPTLQETVLVPYLFPAEGASGLERTVTWEQLLKEEGPLTFEQVPFDHPLWVLYSSGTTGLPKAIVQGHGGIVVEHLKFLGLHQDLKPGDRFFWFTTTGWVMWNILVGGLLVGATILLYDGNPGHPDLGVLWKFAADTGMTLFGTSAAFLTACMKAGLEPGRNYDLGALKSIGSTGSPLPPEGFRWVYDHVKRDLWLVSTSGGTDVCAPFVGGCPLLPVHAGEIQCRLLGVKAEAFDDEGRALVGEVGELVITEPMPSMPLFFWNDPGNRRYLESYFDVYPGVWRHGDWIKITSRGSAVIYGRSDSTLNRMGVRMGTSEIYSAVEDLDEVVDSLIVGVELPGGGYYMPLFVVLKEGVALDEALKAKIRDK
ncbi:MAG: acetoacetate--CoA ligase, partial [Firmicutes bacterium]|nr:acetoacetate--CoA ligase [Bacillota bacterium]